MPFLSPGDLPGPGIEFLPPASLGGFFTSEPPQKPVSDTDVTISQAICSMESPHLYQLDYSTGQIFYNS